MAKILIVDDEENIRSSLKAALERRGHEIVTAESFVRGIEYVAGRFDLMFLDVLLGDGNGIDLLKTALEKNPRNIVVMISGHADIEMAVEATRAGAYDFLEKPLSLDRVLVTIDNVVRTRRLQTEADRLAARAYGEFVGESDQVRQLKADIIKSAPKASRFLILGENGTGKELVASMIHRAGSRSNGPFVAVNCAALPSELVESELFGHIRGSFTGARADRKGKFIEADLGSIFLDEISEMPSEAQAKILRVIETRQVTPVGSSKTVTVDCTIIAASNRNLEQMVAEGTFRQDLLYRLNVVTFALPPLRERKQDIPLLATHFLARFAEDTGLPAKRLDNEALKFLCSYDFPGNIRELKNLMERVNIYCDAPIITRRDLKPLLPPMRVGKPKALKDALLEFEREYIDAAIRRNDGSMAEAAKELGVERSLLYKKVKRLEEE